MKAFGRDFRAGLAALLAAAGMAGATEYSWDVDAAGQWTSAANWLGGAAFPDGVGDVANFTNDVTAGRNITLDDSAGDGIITIGTLRVGDASHRFQFTWAAGTTWVFDDTDGLVEIDVLEGSGTANLKHQIWAPFTINDDLLITHREAGTNPSMRITNNITEGVAGRTLTKAGPGMIWFEASVGHSADTFINGGTVNVWYQGRLPSTTNLVLRNGASLLIDNSSSTGNLTDRLNDTSPIQVYGGTLGFEQNGGAVNYSETMGAVALRSGHLNLSVQPAAAGQSSTLTFASLAREGNATARFTAPGLSATENRIVFTTAPALTGGGSPFSDILPWALAQVATNGTGADYQLVTHDGDGSSLRAYGVDSSEAYADGEASWTATTNARPTADVTYGAVARTVNALVLDDGIDLLGSTADRQLLFNGAGGAGLIVQTGGSSVITNGGNFEVVPAFGVNQGIFHIIGSLSIYRDAINNGLRGTNGFVKAGPGTLSLFTASQVANATIGNNMRGVFDINEGMLELRQANAAGGTVLELNGGTLALRMNASTAFRAQDATVTNTPLSVVRDGTVVIGRATTGGGVTHTLGAIGLADGVTLTLDYTNLNTDADYGLAAASLSLATGATVNILQGPGTGTGLLIVTNVADNGAGALYVRGDNIWRAELHVMEKLAVSNLNVGAAGFPVVVATRDQFTNVTGNITVNNGVLSSIGDVARELGAGPGQVRFVGASQSGLGAFGSDASFTFTQGGQTNALAWGSTDFDIGTFQLNDAEAGAQMTLRNGVDLNAGTGTVTRTMQVDNNIVVVIGPVTNSGPGTAHFTKGGGSTLWLTGDLSWNGTTRISAGPLRIPNVTNLPAGNLVIGAANNVPSLETAGTFLRALGTNLNEFSLTGSGGGNSRPGFSAFGGNLAVDLGGDGTGTGPELFWNSAFFDPEGTNTANTGALLLNTANADGVLTLFNGIDLNGEPGFGARRFEINGSTAVLAGDLRNSASGFDAMGILKRGAGTLMLAGTNTYDGGTTVNAGILAVGAGGATGTLGGGPVTNNATLAFHRSDSMTITNLVSGTGTLAQSGPGTTTLTADNTYSGPTIVSNGTLRINGAQTGLGLITVAGGTLGGSGSVVASNILVQSAGGLAPGNSIGTFSATNLTLDGGATLTWELSDDGVTSDRLVLSGTLAKGAAGAWEFDFLNTGAIGTYTLITFTSTDFADGDFTHKNLKSGLTGTIDVSANDVTLTVLPEPTTAGLMAVFAAAALLRRRRR